MKIVRLNWQKPVELTDGFPERLREASQPGIYAFTGRMYSASSDTLIYMGKTETTFYERNWNEPANRDWLERMSRTLGATFHFAPMDDLSPIKAVETVLIHVHSPPFNSQEIVTPRPIPEHLCIYNQGHLPPNMIPIVATDYPWYGKADPFGLQP